MNYELCILEVIPNVVYVWKSMIVVCVLCCVVPAVVVPVVVVVDIPSTLSLVVNGLCFMVIDC